MTNYIINRFAMGPWIEDGAADIGDQEMFGALYFIGRACDNSTSQPTCMLYEYVRTCMHHIQSNLDTSAHTSAGASSSVISCHKKAEATSFASSIFLVCKQGRKQ